MANLVETQDWVDGVYQIETTDRVLGGADGTANKQAKSLASRTAYLKKRIDTDLAGDGGAGMMGTGYGRTQANRNSEAVHAGDIGCVADGSTDNWQFVVDALASGVRKIFFPAGTYYFSKAISLFHRCEFYGEAGFQSGASPSILQFADNTCGIVIHRYNTTCDNFGYNQTTTAATGEGADGSIIKHLYIRRGANGADTTIDGNSHAIRLRARAHIDSCYISGFAGDGIHIMATSGSADPANEGNANNWGVSNTRVQNCRDGMFVDGADVNVGMAHHVDCSSNQRYGIYDSSFLGCNWIGCHCNGNTTKDILQDSANARSVFIGQYVETGGPGSQLTTPSIAIGGIWGGGVTGGYQLIDGALSGTTLAYSGQSVTTQSSVSGTARISSAWNTGAISTARRVSHHLQAGIPANYMPLGGLLGRGGASNSYTASIVGLEMYDGSAPTTVAISGVTQANPGVIGAVGHGLVPGDRAVILGIVGMTQLNGSYLVNTTPSADTLTVKTLDGTVVDTTAFSAYVSGGTIGKATGYVTAIEARGATKDIVPGSDNVWDLGDAAARYKEVFAVNATINTSDYREKQQICELSEAEKAVALRLKGLIRAFKWNDAVAEKGDGARIHVGVIAQDVEAAFAEEGLNGFDYAVLCYDEWPEQQEERDEDGNVVQAYRPAGNRYGVRYEELFAFIVSAL